MEDKIKTTAKQDFEARQLLYSKTPEEKLAVKTAKSIWKKSQLKQK